MFKKLIALTFFVFSFLTVIPYNTAHASLEVDFRDAGKYLDDFMIKSDFVIDESKYRIHKTSIVDGLKRYTIHARKYPPYASFDVDVDTKTNKIKQFRYFFALPGTTAEQITDLAFEFHSIISSRYGNPSKMKNAWLRINGKEESSTCWELRDKNYTYYYGAFYDFSKPQSSSGILINVRVETP